MRLVSLFSCQAWFVSADLVTKLNDLIARSPAGIYKGGSNPGVVVRAPDFFDAGGNQKVLPATLWHNDIYAPSQMYPTHGSPWCPNNGWDGVYKQDACKAGPWTYAIVGVVLADSMANMWNDFSSIQDDGWRNGVFYASDANSADQRCIHHDEWSGWDCPGGFMSDDGTFYPDDKGGSGTYAPGYPDAANGVGGGAGCHFDMGAQAIDQPDAYDSQGNNLVEDWNCQCHSAYKGRWNKWVDAFATGSIQKDGFQSRDWLNGNGKLAPAWAADAGACWLNNPRDMIDLQNALYWQRASWNNHLIPQTDWDSSSTADLRKYWGWNEIPVAKSIVDDAQNWDAVIIKLPADICQHKKYGHDDVPSCLLWDGEFQLERDLEQFVQNHKLKLGADKIGWRPGSSIVFVREKGYEYGTKGSSQDPWGLNWNREFFCADWTSPNMKYKVVSDLTPSGPVCYIDAGGAPSPSPYIPAPPPPPPPFSDDRPSSPGGVANVNWLQHKCLKAPWHKKAPHRRKGDRIVLADCWNHHPGTNHHLGWEFTKFMYKDGMLKYDGSPSNDPVFCLDATGMNNGDSVILWDCNGLPQQKWTHDVDYHRGTGVFRLPNGHCLDAFDSGIQVWECNGQDQQKWWWSKNGQDQQKWWWSKSLSTETVV